MTGCRPLRVFRQDPALFLSAENTKATEADPISHRRGQRGEDQTGVLLREVGNGCFILQFPLQGSYPARHRCKWYRLKGGASDTPTFPPVPHSVVEKMETHPCSELTCVRDKYLQSGVETLDHTGLRQVLSSGPNFLSLP
jgi:hypothetical protein